MSQGALAFSSPGSAPPPVTTHLRLLAGLDTRLPCFARKAAARIAAFDTARLIEAALAEVPRDFVAMVDTLVVGGLATRIAQALDPGTRAVLLAEVPEALKARVEPLAKSYAVRFR